jgi:hypothetical protein
MAGTILAESMLMAIGAANAAAVGSPLYDRRPAG